jgi:hypothetical protein
MNHSLLLPIKSPLLLPIKTPLLLPIKSPLLLLPVNKYHKKNNPHLMERVDPTLYRIIK